MLLNSNFLGTKANRYFCVCCVLGGGTEMDSVPRVVVSAAFPLGRKRGMSLTCELGCRSTLRGNQGDQGEHGRFSELCSGPGSQVLKSMEKGAKYFSEFSVCSVLRASVSFARTGGGGRTLP